MGIQSSPAFWDWVQESSPTTFQNRKVSLSSAIPRSLRGGCHASIQPWDSTFNLVIADALRDWTQYLSNFACNMCAIRRWVRNCKVWVHP